MATKQNASDKLNPLRKPLQVCSGGRVVVKPGQTRYEAQQEAANKPKQAKQTEE